MRSKMTVTAFSAENDRFTTPLQDQVFNQTAGVNDTVEVPDPLTGVVKVISRRNQSSVLIQFILSV
jgi:uncharacterized protein YkvS